MEGIKTFEEVYGDMNTAYNNYLKTGDSDRLWELCHQVLSNALFVLNEDEVEDEFIYEFSARALGNTVISKLLNTGVGRIVKVGTVPSYGVVWLITEDGQEYDDDARELTIWEIFNIATALYKMTEPLSALLYN